MDALLIPNTLKNLWYNRNMKLKRSGFTLIEVSIFLAITGLLFIGIAVGTGNSIRQQRFTDSVQNFAEFLKTVYSEAANPQSRGNGRSNTAIYGKLVTFGETVALNGEQNTEHKIFTYDVVGNVGGEVGTGNLVEVLQALGASAAINGEAAGFVNSYLPKWGAEIENTDNSNLFVGAVLVVRHPNSGTMNTLVMKGRTVEVNQAIKNKTANPLSEALKNKWFGLGDVDFCIDPNASNDLNGRQDIRIITRAANASGVQIISMDGGDNRCLK